MQAVLNKIREINFITAAGRTPCDSAVEAIIDGVMNVATEVLLLEDTPALMSVGKRVMEDEIAFIWLPGKRPCFMLPDGKLYH